ncbi:amino acid adenylation domain-containing protein [Streptomyces sp. WA6-1-16]|uniref:non-ribosomal peptide synthetase n=1 Tax=Streptomyces sp. WA6-1-16 TaxID=2879427 RepID=UPI001CE304CD|nr:non-ribosomal peptide synthetase [Streptomyces sp. WA6-1-16]UCA51873.1 amino acid adenylation domain-containing protein [Streptomyces sp. WA6-1-16]
MTAWQDVLETAAIRTPDRTAFTYRPDGDGPETGLTYEQLHERAAAVAADLTDRGLTGERALLLHPFGLEYVVTFFGCLYAGVVAVPTYPPSRHPSSTARFSAVAEDCGARVALTTADLREKLERRSDLPAASALTMVVPEPSSSGAGSRPVRPRGEDLAFLQYTSGSTGRPKGVMLSHANLLANTALIQDAFGLGEHTRAVSWLPMYHDMGLIGSVLGTVFCGGSTLLLPPSSFARDPGRWLSAISDFGATVSGGPDFAYNLCVERVPAEVRASLDLSSWQVAFSGAEPVRERTLRSFAAAFAESGFSAQAFLPCYGLAESALIVTAGERGSGFRTAAAEGAHETVVGSGRAPDGVGLRTVDPETGAVTPDGAEGEVQVSGASVARGYWNRPEDWAEVFRDGWLRTGDLGFLRDGELHVTGRAKDLVIVRGRNHHPQDLESTAEGADSRLRTHGCAVFAVPGAEAEELVVACELRREAGRGDLDEIARRVRAAVAAAHDVRPRHVVLVPFAGLARTSSGKIARSACRQQFLDGTLAALGVRSTTRTAGPEATEPAAGPGDVPGGDAGRLRGEIAALLGIGVDEVSPDTPLVDLGIDSLDALTIAHRVGRRTGRDLVAETLLHHSVRELVALGTRPQDGAAPSSEPGDHPLSAQQRGMRYSHELAPESTAYLLGAAVDVYGLLDVEALREALEGTVERHSVLRTTFPVVGGEPVQRVHARLGPGFRVEDVPSALLGSRTAAVSTAPLDIVDGPLVRLCVLRTGPDRHRLVLTLHHLVSDLWSIDLVLREVCARYTGSAPPHGRAADFVELVAGEAAFTEGPEGRRLAEHWRAALDGAPADIGLRTDRPRPALPRLRGASTTFTVSAGTTARLRRHARANGTTLFTVLLSAYALLLWRYSGRRDFLVGTPVHGRGSTRSSEVVGCCINTVPVRCRVDPDGSFGELLGRVGATSRDAFDHAGLPFVELIEAVGARRDPSRPPLVQVMFALQQALPGGDLPIAAMAVNRQGVTGRFGPAVCESVALPRTGSMADLALHLAEVGDGLSGELVHDTDLFDDGTAQRLARQFVSVLETVVSGSGGPVREFATAEPSVLTGAEAGYRSDDHVHLRIARQALLRPEAVAVSTDEEELTYGRLEHSAGALARVLVARGVRPGHVVAIRLPRGAEFVVSMLAVLKAGAAYLPLAPDLPESRIGHMLTDSGAHLVISRSGVGRSEPPCPVLDLDAVGRGAPEGRSPEVPAHPEAAAYVLYTSGSTGLPKGVHVPHRALNNFLAAMARVVPMDARTRLLAPTSLSFDISVLEVFLPLVSGGTCHLADGDTVRDGHALRARLDTGAFTHMQATPVTWQLLADTGWAPDPGLTVITGGEALPRELAAYLCASGGQVLNMYGPTETTVWSASAPLALADTAEAPPIGLPVANTTAYVLDEGLALVPAGAEGELHLGGHGLATGYPGRPGLTASRFLPDPFRGVPGGRMYATGDLVRVRADGRIEFLGRMDRQVKVNGLRVELGEIEAQLDRVPGVTRSVAEVYRGASGPVLVAYVTGDTTASDRQILSGLKAVLPGYMVPARLVRLPRLPVNSSGKVDRGALPPPPVAAGGDEDPATGPEERRIAAVLAELLGLPSVGRSVSIFDIGGNSLLMTRLTARIDKEFDVRLSLRQIVEDPTVAGLAAQVTARQRASGPGRPAVAPVVRVDRSRYAARNMPGV